MALNKILLPRVAHRFDDASDVDGKEVTAARAL
jgi:hypothetical protein